MSIATLRVLEYISKGIRMRKICIKKRTRGPRGRQGRSLSKTIGREKQKKKVVVESDKKLLRIKSKCRQKTE
jgi:hypothetical protein